MMSPREVRALLSLLDNMARKAMLKASKTLIEKVPPVRPPVHETNCLQRLRRRCLRSTLREIQEK